MKDFDQKEMKKEWSEPKMVQLDIKETNSGYPTPNGEIQLQSGNLGSL